MINHLRKDFKSFYLPLILSIIISYIFYLLSIKDRIPVFSTEPLRTQIIDAKNIATAPIRVIGPDSMIIKNDLSAVIFHFWNRGGEAIDSADILKSLDISLSDTAARFIDVKTNKISRADITKTKIRISKDRKRLHISFDILDEDDGLSCQTIFEGNPKSELIINGAIKGVKTFDKAGVSILQFASIALALSALATFLIILITRILTWYTYITYKDYYVDNFYYYLDSKQLDKAEAYAIQDRRDSEIFKQLLDTYSTDKTKFDEISSNYISNIQIKNKEYFYNTPIYSSPFWSIARQAFFLFTYIAISVATWNLLKANPNVLNPINKSSYYSMIKSIIFTPESRK